MKRVLAMCLVCVMLLPFAACTASPETVQLDDVTLSIGDRYYDIVPVKEQGDAQISLSQEGVIELIDSFWDDDNGQFFIDFQGIAVGQVTVTVDIAKVSYQMNVTVGTEPTVKITEGSLCRDISVDKTNATVYVDDTTVTYTVVTAPTVDRLTFEQLASPSPLYSYNSVIEGASYVFALATLTIDDSTLTDVPTAGDNQSAYTARKELCDDKAVWTVQWDLGYTAVSILRISAFDTAAGQEHVNYVHLNIAYPVLDPSEGLESIALYWLKLNIDEPLLFTVDTGKLTERQQFISDNIDKAAIFESELFMMNGLTGERAILDDAVYYLQKELSNQEYYDLMFDSSPLFHMHTLEQLNTYGLISVITGNDPENVEYYSQLGGKNRLVSNYYLEDATYIFYGSIAQDTRAVMAYLYGLEIDEEAFPYAYSILQRADAVLDEIISDGMTDFEKEKAIYGWMINNYNDGLNELEADSSNERIYYVTKTAYGLLSGYHGDCAGWSATFFTLCNMAGLACSTVDVLAEAGGPVEFSYDFNVDHRINLIRLDGEYYFVDVFWFYQKSSPAEGDYRVMNMTTEQAAEKYTWINEDGFGPVECNYSTYLVDANTGELLH